jgi:hypothetical protein
MEQYDSRVDAYIAKSADYAQPVLIHLRTLVHEASPLITETIKWSCPVFEYNGIVCFMRAFKQHCSFGLWKHKELDDPGGLLKSGEEGGGSLGRLTSLADLPKDEHLVAFIKQCVGLNNKAAKGLLKKAGPQSMAPLVVPGYITDILDDYPEAKTAFEKLSSLHQREYMEWILDANTETLRQKRIETALGWMIEGKSRHWKYRK